MLYPMLGKVVRVTDKVAKIVVASYDTIMTVDRVTSEVHGAPS